jgi:hypothetical protein
MIVKTQDGKDINLAAPAINFTGLKVKTVTLHAKDIGRLANMSIGDLYSFLHQLQTCMYAPKTSYEFVPLDENNLKLKLEGEDYLCIATNKAKAV